MKAEQLANEYFGPRNLVNFLLWRALQRKLYRQEIGDVDHLQRVLLHCWIR